MFIFLDMDGVITDFIGEVCKVYGCKNPYLDERNLGNPDLVELLDMTEPGFWAGISNLDFWRNIPMLPHALELIDMIQELGLPITLVTTPCLCPVAAQGKIEWIYKFLPKFAHSYLIGPSRCMCAGLNKLLIDDSDHEIERFKLYGGHTIQVPGPNNRLYADRHHIVEKVKQDLCGLIGSI